MAITASSPTLQIARQRVTTQAAPAAPALGARRPPRAAATAFAVAVSWLAAGALVIGLVWAASTVSLNPPTETPADTLPYAIGWSLASLAILASSVGSLFAPPARRSALIALAGTLALALLASAVAANALL